MVLDCPGNDVRSRPAPDALCVRHIHNDEFTWKREVNPVLAPHCNFMTSNSLSKQGFFSAHQLGFVVGFATAAAAVLRLSLVP